LQKAPVKTGSRVLVADDNPELSRIVATRLQNSGHHVSVVGDADAVVQALSRQPFDVLVLDLKMPGGSDLELLARLCSRGVKIPVVIMTGHPSMQSAVAALNAGVVAYLIKPFRSQDLLEAVESAASGSRSEHLLRLATDQLGAVEPPSRFSGQPRSSPARSDPASDEAPTSQPDAFEALAELSPREREVLHWALAGDRPAAISKRLFISPHTVRNHLKAIFRKLRVHSQIELIRRFGSIARMPPGAVGPGGEKLDG